MRRNTQIYMHVGVCVCVYMCMLVYLVSISSKAEKEQVFNEVFIKRKRNVLPYSPC